MWFAIGFGTVCVISGYYYAPKLLLLGCAGLGLIAALCFLARYKHFFRILSAIMLGCSVGCGWFLSYDALYLTGARGFDTSTCEFDIHVTDYSWNTDYGIGVDGYVKLNGKLYKTTAYLDGSGSLEPGDKIAGTFRARFTTDGKKSQPSAFRGEGIFLILYQSGDVSVTKADKLPWYGYPAYWRQKLLLIIEDAFPEDTAGFAQALLLGYRDGLRHETQTVLKISGIQHIVAVSGLHVSILCGLLYVLTLRKRVPMFLLGAPALLLFTAVVGFTPSVTRACIMHFLMLLAQLIEREYDPPTELAFSVLVMLAINPLTVVSISFQLSVACMIGIFLFSGRIRNWFSDTARFGHMDGKGIIPALKRWFVNSVSITLSATVTTTPLVAYYFGTVSLVSVLTNLLTLWAVTVIFYGIVAVCLLSFAALNGACVIGSILSWLIRYVLAVSKALSSLPFAAVYTESIYTVIWLIGSYLLLAIYLFMKRKRPALLFCCTVLCLVLSVAASWTEPLLYGCCVTVLDVGQGQCILFQSGGKTFLVDCGGEHSESVGDLAADTLLSRGINRIDGLILTHYDEDHAGGAQYLLDRIRADSLFLPDIEDEKGVVGQLAKKTDAQLFLVNEDKDISFDGIEIQIFAPISYNSGNESSLCVLFRTEKCDILITGDRGQLGEMILLRQAQLPKLELLVVGHHGSASSTTKELLAAVQPETAVISVGKNNRYGHPAKSVLDRLEEFGCKIYRTDINGTIVFRR